MDSLTTDKYMDELEKNILDIQEIFSKCSTQESIYSKIMELGRLLPRLEPKFLTSDLLVQGCQSQMFLLSTIEDQKMYFKAYSDALISAGLAAILIRLYSGLSPEIILKHNLSFLEDLGITNSLSANRSNGLFQIHLRMKQDALKALIE